MSQTRARIGLVEKQLDLKIKVMRPNLSIQKSVFGIVMKEIENTAPIAFLRFCNSLFSDLG